MQHIWCFDLDGTLVNTSDLNHKAYDMVGVTVPTYAAGLPWQSWLVEYAGSHRAATYLHLRKIAEYAKLLLDTTVDDLRLPPLDIALKLFARDPNSVVVLSAASMPAATQLLQICGIHGVQMEAGLTYPQRLSHVRQLAETYRVHYLDDNEATIMNMRRDTLYKPIIPVLYEGQDVPTLQHELQVTL